MTKDLDANVDLRKAAAVVALLNLAYFFVEFGFASRLGSVSLFADSIDFLEDAALNGIILFGLSQSASVRSRLGLLCCGLLLVPSVATLATLVRELLSRTPPHGESLSLVGLGALAVNFFCAMYLARFRRHPGSLVKAAFFSARNDVLANIAIVAAGGVIVWIRSAWPDLVVGAGIMILNADASLKVYRAARREGSGVEA